ncbi:MAG: gamma-glutamyltransferase [Alphaproteobacteria bacterium]|nr:gamma-glutamyltransferase [Alphaproteobacteria bacterium]
MVVVLCGSIVTLAACGGARNEPIGTAAPVTGYYGSIASDEPRATLVGRDILANNGSAVDAAVAAAFTLAVTLPSRAGVGGGGACLVRDAKAKKTEAIVFLPQPTTLDGRVPAAVPALARGLFAMHARYGRQRWGEILTQAENLARFGFPVSRALATDLGRHGPRLAGDPELARTFLDAHAAPLGEGATVSQFALAAVLTQLRTAGPADLYGGRYAHVFAEAARAAGASMTIDDLRQAVPSWTAPAETGFADERLYMLPSPIVGGEAMASLWRRIADGGAYRRSGPAALAGAPAADRGIADASTGLAVADRDGSAVACVLTMGRPFGTGRSARGTGVILAPPADAAATQAMAAALMVNTNVQEFFLAAAAGGGGDAPAVLAGAMAAVLIGERPLEAAFSGLDAGRAALANIVSCPFGAPRKPESCATRADPRGHGLAAVPGQ